MSDKKLAIKLSTLEGIGNAVREKEGSTEPIPVNALADRIGALQIGGDEKFKQLLNRTITEITAEDLKDCTVIPQYALANCKNLKKITIPNTVVEFAQYSFNSTNIEETRYEGELWEWCNIKRTTYFSISFGNLYIKDELLPENIVVEPTTEMLRGYSEYIIQPYAFYKSPSLKTLKLLNPTVRYTLIDYALSSCLNLSRVDIGSKKLHDYTGNSTIGYRLPTTLFSGCSNLTDIYVCWSEGEIKNAPWGASNATIHYDTPAPFYLEGKEYFASLKTTWADWCNSADNTDGFYVDENDRDYVKRADGTKIWPIKLDGKFDNITPKGTHTIFALSNNKFGCMGG